MSDPHSDPCPLCGFDLDGGDVFERLFKKYDGDRERALKDATCFGWSEKNKKRFSKKICVSDFLLDRVTHYICPKCMKKIRDREINEPT